MKDDLRMMYAAQAMDARTSTLSAEQMPARAIQTLTEQLNMMNDMAYRLWSNMSGEIDRISGRELTTGEAGAKPCEPVSELDALRQSAERLHDHLATCLNTAQRLTSI